MGPLAFGVNIVIKFNIYIITYMYIYIYIVHLIQSGSAVRTIYCNNILNTFKYYLKIMANGICENIWSRYRTNRKTALGQNCLYSISKENFKNFKKCYKIVFFALNFTLLECITIKLS
jgi:hypothetical protein